MLLLCKKEAKGGKTILYLFVLYQRDAGRQGVIKPLNIQYRTDRRLALVTTERNYRSSCLYKQGNGVNRMGVGDRPPSLCLFRLL